jgi:hypothetical protein
MKLACVLNRLHCTINTLESLTPALIADEDLDGVLDGDLEQQNNISKMLDLKVYWTSIKAHYEHLPIKPLTVLRCDQTVFSGNVPVFFNSRHTGDVDFNISHSSNGYDVVFYFLPYGITNMTYPALDAQQLFAKITAESDVIFHRWLGY